MMKLEIPTLNEVLEEAGGNELLLEDLSSKFRLWLQQQQHLPQDVSDQRLKFFICTAKFDFEKAKTHLDTLYTLRNLLPEFFGTLDPFNDRIIQFHKYFQWVVMPRLTPERYRLTICRLINTDASIYDPWIVIRYGLMMLDMRIEEDLVNSHVFIWDCAGISIGHVLKFTPMLMKKLQTCMEAYGLRVKGIHFINAPKIVDLLLISLKSVIKTKLFNRMYTYTSGMESLDDIIPKSILPVDFGGEQPSMSTLTDMWRAKLAKQRDWFLKEETFVTNESLRTNSTINPDEFFGVSGTFRKIEVD